MNSPQISVIVPVYNAEKYLRRCIESILTQTFTDFELLLIDDGSKDNSLHICEEFAKNDSRIRVFHKKNGGVSSARNVGLDNINGKWLAFIDSDDIIEQDYLYNLIIKSDEVDFVICGYKQIGKQNKIVIYHEAIYDMNSKKEMSFFDKSELEAQSLFYCPWRKLYKSDIIKKHNIKFETNIFLGEDTCFIISYINYVNKIRTIKSTSYTYELPYNPNKYSMNFDEFESHIETFDSYLSTLERYKDLKFNKIRAMMYGVYLSKYISYLMTLDAALFKDGIIKFRQSVYFGEIQSTLFKHWNIKKKIAYYLIYTFPVIGYQLKKYIHS